MPATGPARDSGPVLPGALSPLTADLVRGPRRPAAVLAAGRFGAYLGLAGRVLPVVAGDALALPGALRLAVPSVDLDLGAEPGEVVLVGGGTVGFPHATVRGVRTWRPARVRPLDAVGADLRGVRHVLADVVTDAPAWLVGGASAVLGAADPDVAVGALVGRGPGLTPSGDDALAGALLVRRGLALAPRPGATDPLVDAVRARVERTTAVSASLLLAAADGWATREAVALVDAAVRGDVVGTEAALPGVLAVGHTSGRDLVTGVAAALDTLCRGRHAA